MRNWYLVLAALLVGCGGSTKEAKDPSSDGADTQAPTETSSPSDGDSGASKAPKEAADDSIPTACANPGEDVCVMPAAFAKKLCNGFYPDVALYMFSPNSPWKRAYVNIKEADAWNSRGGPASDAKLVYDEEVIIVSEQKPDLKGMTVSGAGSSYDFLRWDGTCASLTAAEMSLNKPPKPKFPPIPWRSIEDETQEALEKDESFAELVKIRRKECKGASIGTVSDKCEKADKKMNDAVVKLVRDGVDLPKPKKLPK